MGGGAGGASQDKPGVQDLLGEAGQVKKAVCPPPIFPPPLVPRGFTGLRARFRSVLREAASDVYLLPSLGSFELGSPGPQTLWPQGLNGYSHTESWTRSPWSERITSAK